MIQDVDLRALCEYEGPDRVFLSVYVGGQRGAQAVEHRLDRLRRVIEADGDERELEHFDENARMAWEWIDAHRPDSGTACVFACFALDLLRGFELDLELPSDARIGVAPYVRPLAEAQDDYQTFAVVAADNELTRVFLVTAEQNEFVEQIRGDVKNHVRKGGWSQKRYQRRRDHELLHYAREVAERLEALSRDEGFDRIVLIGSEETMIAIEAELHPSLRERVIARDNLDLEDGEDSLVAAAFDHYWAAERASEQQLWERVRAEYKAGALAAVGATDVLHAVQNGRVEALLIDREASIQGVRCGECENTMHGVPTSCQICGARALSEVDLVNELTRQAELTGAEVEYADPIAGLSNVGGVAALLRY